MCNCCSHGTLLHNSVLQGFAEVIATTTKICACGGSTRALAQIASAHTAASFLLVGRRSIRKTSAPPTAGHSRLAQRHPFSGLVDSAGELLHTPWRIPTSMATVLLSVSTNTFYGV